jgi:membrane-associated phospholipid phosphatase
MGSAMFLAALLLAGLQTPTGPPDPPPPAGPPPAHTGVKATLKAIPGDFAHLPSRDSLVVISIGTALTLAAHPFDNDVNAHLRGAHGFFAPGKVVGDGFMQAGLAVGTYIFGRATDNRVVSHLGMDLVRATAEVGALTFTMKLAFGRKRPSGECCAFPSGHSSLTFASATVLQRHLGWKAAVPTYALASYVAVSRLHENRHYLSDVVFGATLGLIVGRTVTRHGRSDYTWAPVPVPGGIGIVVAGTIR